MANNIVYRYCRTRH